MALEKQNKGLADLDAALEELNELIGLKAVKEKIASIARLIQNFNLRRERGLKVPKISNCMAFIGDPGTGKTTVGRILFRIFKALGVLQGKDDEDGFVEASAFDLVSSFVGQSAYQTKKVIEKAKGGILFLDEPYNIIKASQDFGFEAWDALLWGIEENRDNLVVVFSGSNKGMKRFFEYNSMLEARINIFIHFDDYTIDELIEIFKLMLRKNDYELAQDALENAKKYFNDLCLTKGEGFANAHDARDLFDKATKKQATRLSLVANPTKEQLVTITAEDLDF